MLYDVTQDCMMEILPEEKFPEMATVDPALCYDYR